MKMVKKQVNNGMKALLQNRFFLLIVIVILFDRLTKQIITRMCPCVVAPILNFISATNKGIAFGLFSGTEYANIIFSLIAVVAISLITAFLFQTKNEKVRLGLILMIGGAASNLIDRIVYGSVIDIFDFHLSIWRFPAFNVADAAITIGAFIAIMALFKEGKEEAYKPVRASHPSGSASPKKSSSKKRSSKKKSPAPSSKKRRGSSSSSKEQSRR